MLRRPVLPGHPPVQTGGSHVLSTSLFPKFLENVTAPPAKVRANHFCSSSHLKKNLEFSNARSGRPKLILPSCAAFVSIVPSIRNGVAKATSANRVDTTVA